MKSERAKIQTSKSFDFGAFPISMFGFWHSTILNKTKFEIQSSIFQGYVFRHLVNVIYCKLNTAKHLNLDIQKLESAKIRMETSSDFSTKLDCFGKKIYTMV